VAGEVVSVTVEPLGQLCPVGNLTIGQPVSDSLVSNCRSIIGENHYVKQYKFQGRAGQRVAVVLSSPEFSPVLWLKRMDGEDGLFAARLTPEINFQSYEPGMLRMPRSGYITLPADGAYFLEVATSRSPDQPGSFTLSVQEASSGDCNFDLSTNRQSLNATWARGSVNILGGGNCMWKAAASASWIKLTNTGGNGNGLLEYSVEPNAGAYRTGVIAVAGQHLFITQAPGNAVISVVSAADYSSGLTMGAIHAMFGNGLASQTLVATTQPLPVTLDGTQVTLADDLGNSYDAQLFFVSPGQINFRVQLNVPPGPVNLIVKRNGQQIASTRFGLELLAPALFTADGSGRGVPAAYLLRVRRDNSRIEEPIYDRDASGRITFDPLRHGLLRALSQCVGG
jgi:hypothetical protein